MTTSSEKDPKKIAAMFSSIADRYDFLNGFLSMGQARRWRNRLIHGADLPTHGLILDLCTGSGDIALGFLTEREEYKGYIYGVDFSVPMIDMARSHVARLGAPYPMRVEFLMGDAMDLNFNDDKFNLVTIGYGLRNLSNTEEGLYEINRVLKSGAQLNAIEFFSEGIKSGLIRWYVDNMVPWLGNVILHTDAYTYLRDSSNKFYTTEEFTELLEKTGFTDILWEPMTFGIAHIVRARKR